MSKAEERAYSKYPKEKVGVLYDLARNSIIEGYKQAERDIKEELSSLFQEFMLDCIKDDTETHILHFVDVFNNKIKTIGNE